MHRPQSSAAPAGRLFRTALPKKAYGSSARAMRHRPSACFWTALIQSAMHRSTEPSAKMAATKGHGGANCSVGCMRRRLRRGRDLVIRKAGASALAVDGYGMRIGDRPTTRRVAERGGQSVGIHCPGFVERPVSRLPGPSTLHHQGNHDHRNARRLPRHVFRAILALTLGPRIRSSTSVTAASSSASRAWSRSRHARGACCDRGRGEAHARPDAGQHHRHSAPARRRDQRLRRDRADDQVLRAKGARSRRA